MIFGQSTRKQAAGRAGSKRGKLQKLHSVGALMKGREFNARVEIGEVPYDWTYSPSSAAITGNKLRLSGTLTVLDARPNVRATPRSIQGVTATLLAIQGGIGATPPLKKAPAEVYQPQPGIPIVDSSGSLSFTGVMYFRIGTLSGTALGMNADLSGVQLNARMAPADDKERALQAAYSQAADSLLGKKIDSGAANEAVTDLNRLLSGA
jgi:hypothetical protein